MAMTHKTLLLASALGCCPSALAAEEAISAAELDRISLSAALAAAVHDPVILAVAISALVIGWGLGFFVWYTCTGTPSGLREEREQVAAQGLSSHQSVHSQQKRPQGSHEEALHHKQGESKQRTETDLHGDDTSLRAKDAAGASNGLGLRHRSAGESAASRPKTLRTAARCKQDTLAAFTGMCTHVALACGCAK